MCDQTGKSVMKSSKRTKLNIEPGVDLSSSDSAASSINPQPSSTRNRVVVFDFDCTLAKHIFEDSEWTKKNHPECPLIEFDHYKFICLPHLRILFEYLLERGVRIAFFSSAEKKYNVIRIPRLLTTVFGSQKYEELKSKGQFEIFSEEDLRKRDRSLEDSGNYKKDLRVVVRDGDSLSDILLVEDDPSFVAHDQQPCFKIIDLLFWGLSGTEDSFSDYSFPKNGTYYMLGVFMTYFEEEKYEKLPFREGIDQLIPKPDEFQDFVKKNPFVINMIDKGLSEVQKQVPSAVFYGRRDFD